MSARPAVRAGAALALALRRRSAAAVLCALALAGCGGGPSEEAAAERPPVAVYTVRGEIDTLPAENDPRRWVMVRHEAISDFVGVDGAPEPMDSMTMTFGVADSVDLSTLAPGDKVRFELQVDWSASDPARVLAIEPLPPEAELDLGNGGTGSRPI